MWNARKIRSVIPAQAGIQFQPTLAMPGKLDSRLRGNDVVRKEWAEGLGR
jgi:hypothetical protein